MLCGRDGYLVFADRAELGDFSIELNAEALPKGGSFSQRTVHCETARNKDSFS